MIPKSGFLRSTGWRWTLSIFLTLVIFSVSGILFQPFSQPKTFVSITFDDGLADQLQAAQALTLNGMHGTFYIISGKVGQRGYLTWAALSAIQAQGHEIGGHTLNHPNLTNLTGYPLRHEICDDRVALMQHGLRVVSFAYSYGQANSETANVVAKCGYNSARTVVGKQEKIPPTRPYFMNTMDPVQSDTTMNDLRLPVKQAERAGGGWVQYVFHHVCDGCDKYAITEQDFNAFLHWLKVREPDGTVVRSIDEVLGGPVQPPTPAQP